MFPLKGFGEALMKAVGFYAAIVLCGILTLALIHHLSLRVHITIQ
jgi:hypothetical protein